MLVGAFQCTIVLGSWEEAELIVIGRRMDLSVCQWMDEFGLPTILYKVFCDRNCNKVKCDLV